MIEIFFFLFASERRSVSVSVCAFISQFLILILTIGFQKKQKKKERKKEH